ncbi:MAG: hypothetical protein HYV18_02875 [Gammaproteobacteria bacterium]|nr:hypothetical protein [Gammaproteobacteria bacterium]
MELLHGRSPGARSGRGHLTISLRTVGQLFNSFDPSPFYEKDLDVHAEQFLVSWVQELPADTPLKLTLQLREWPRGADPRAWIEEAVHHYFEERARLTRAERGQLLRQGRTSLAIGMAFLATCLLLAELLAGLRPAMFGDVLRESLTIGGWVAMWRPLQIYLYDWWPLRRQEEVYRRMSRMPVELRVPVRSIGGERARPRAAHAGAAIAS